MIRASEFGIALPVRDHFGMLLDAENRQIGNLPPPYMEYVVELINSTRVTDVGDDNETLKVVRDSSVLNGRDKSQITGAWDQIVDSGRWMIQVIESDLPASYTPEFDKMHRLRHSLRDLFSIISVLIVRGNTIYSPEKK